jgi:hypothetical protein
MAMRRCVEPDCVLGAKHYTMSGEILLDGSVCVCPVNLSR